MLNHAKQNYLWNSLDIFGSIRTTSLQGQLDGYIAIPKDGRTELVKYYLFDEALNVQKDPSKRYYFNNIFQLDPSINVLF